ncbi:MAG: helix-turn-helix transcriptional regulator [Prevotella sp.]|nr:helix-turn-helix transcriptional regulator [Prevotella sp.]MBQ4446212.1 helix-turn-helix transcriptional regulator [Prevotella sp.]
MNKKDFITLEESKDDLLGRVGSPARDSYEEDIKLYAIGAAIRETRKKQNLTQEELGRMIGVQKAQISRIENGRNLTFATVLKLFKAMNISVNLDIDQLGKVALC